MIDSIRKHCMLVIVGLLAMIMVLTIVCMTSYSELEDANRRNIELVERKAMCEIAATSRDNEVAQWKRLAIEFSNKLNSTNDRLSPEHNQDVKIK